MTHTATIEPIAATPVSLSPMDAAWAQFCLKVHANRPRDLRHYNSPQALSGRCCDIDVLMLAAKDLFVALVEDTAEHVALADRAGLVATVEANMTDMAGEVRGALLNAIHRNAA